MTGKQTIRLGGTSNHFRIARAPRARWLGPLQRHGRCRSGVRIARARLSVMMLDSVTWEEAVAPRCPVGPATIALGQGLHANVSRPHAPPCPTAATGRVDRAFLSDFQIMVGGSSLIPLVNPLMWALTAVYFLRQRHGACPDDSVAVSVSAVLSGAALSLGNFGFFVVVLTSA